MHRHFISIWFFIGLLLDAYGALILGAGLWGLARPPAHPVQLAFLHAGIWWGGLLLILGLVYTFKFKPRRDEK
jgi:hypothetical protein